MKPIRFKYLLFMLLLSGAFTACLKKANTSPSPNLKTAVINVDVLYTCNGCPGSAYDIRFTGDSMLYHISNSLTQFGITPSSSFPVNVTVSAKIDSAVATNFVTINTLKINK